MNQSTGWVPKVGEAFYTYSNYDNTFKKHTCTRIEKDGCVLPIQFLYYTERGSYVYGSDVIGPTTDWKTNALMQMSDNDLIDELKRRGLCNNINQ